MNTEATTTTRIDIFYWTENNRVHPHTLPCKVVTIEAPAGLSAWDYVEAARAQGRNIPKGSSRCGVCEIQTDEGIFTRVGPNKQEATVFEFKTWEQIEADEAAEDATTDEAPTSDPEPVDDVDQVDDVEQVPAPTFRNQTLEAVFTELDSLLGKVASVHTLAVRLSIQEQTVRTTLSKLKQRDLVRRVDGSANVWEVAA